MIWQRTDDKPIPELNDWISFVYTHTCMYVGNPLFKNRTYSRRVLTHIHTEPSFSIDIRVGVYLTRFYTFRAIPFQNSTRISAHFATQLVIKCHRKGIDKGWSKDFLIAPWRTAVFAARKEAIPCLPYRKIPQWSLLPNLYKHDDVKWKHFPRYWSFVRGIHRSRWIPCTKTSDAELWCFLSAPE